MNNKEKVDNIVSFMEEASEYYRMKWEGDITRDYLLSRLNSGNDNSLVIFINESIALNILLYSQLYMYVHFFYKEVCIFQIHLGDLCLETFRKKLKIYAEKEIVENINKYKQRNNYLEELLINR